MLICVLCPFQILTWDMCASDVFARELLHYWGIYSGPLNTIAPNLKAKKKET